MEDRKRYGEGIKNLKINTIVLFIYLYYIVVISFEMNQETVVFGTECMRREGNIYDLVKEKLPKITPAIGPTDFWEFIRKCGIESYEERYKILEQYLMLSTTIKLKVADFIFLIQEFTFSLQCDFWLLNLEKFEPKLTWKDVAFVMANLSVYVDGQLALFKILEAFLIKQSNPDADTVHEILTGVTPKVARHEIALRLVKIMQPISSMALLGKFYDMYGKMKSYKVDDLGLDKKLELQPAITPTATHPIIVILSDAKTEKKFYQPTFEKLEKLDIDAKYFVGKPYIPHCLNSGIVVMAFPDGHYETKAQWDEREKRNTNPIPYPIPRLFEVYSTPDSTIPSDVKS
jgi:hypothetical protein